MQCAKIFYFSVTLRFSVIFPIPFTVREELNFRKKEAVFEKKRHEFWEIKNIPRFQPPHRKSINFNIFSPYIFRCQIIVLRAACTIRGKKVTICDKHSIEAKCIRCIHSKYFTLEISVFVACACGYGGRENATYMFKC